MHPAMHYLISDVKPAGVQQLIALVCSLACHVQGQD